MGLSLHLLKLEKERDISGCLARGNGGHCPVKLLQWSVGLCVRGCSVVTTGLRSRTGAVLGDELMLVGHLGDLAHAILGVLGLLNLLPFSSGQGKQAFSPFTGPPGSSTPCLMLVCLFFSVPCCVMKCTLAQGQNSLMVFFSRRCLSCWYKGS